MQKTNWRSKLRFSIIFLLECLLFFGYPSHVLAEVAIVLTDFPQVVHPIEEFTINFAATGLEGDTYYYGKIRAGKDASELNKAETFNEQSSTWLSDNESWVNFPLFSSNSAGNMNASLKARLKASASIGEILLVVRIHQKDTTNNFDSTPPISLDLVESPTPTVTPEPTATMIPDPTPTLVPTDVLNPTSTLTSAPTPVSYANIYLNEFLANPENGNEKVEIKNTNSFSVTLTNWQIDDIENGGHAPKVFSAEISPSGIYTIDLGTDSFLNNDGDSVRLLDFNGVEKDKKEYSGAAKNLSWAKDRYGNWCEQTSSFNSENSDCVIPTPTLTPVPTATSTLRPTATLTPTVNPKLTLSPTPTEVNSEVLGEQFIASESQSFKEPPALANKEGVKEKVRQQKNYLFPVFAIILGSVFIGMSAFFLLKSRNKLVKL